jgi:hypothetical protein
MPERTEVDEQELERIESWVLKRIGEVVADISQSGLPNDRTALLFICYFASAAAELQHTFKREDYFKHIAESLPKAPRVGVAVLTVPEDTQH